METIQQLTQNNFDEVAAKPGITVIDFWASWCWPCRAMAPQLERAAQLRPEYHFAKVEVDAEPGLAAQFDIVAIPTLVVLRDGQRVTSRPGLIAADALVSALDQIAAADRIADADGTAATGTEVAA